MTVDFKEFVTGFLAEADELLQSIRSHLLAIDDAGRDGKSAPRAVREVYRALHTMKGLAGMVGVEPIVDVAHAMESVVRAAERRGGRIETAGVEQLLEGVKALSVRLRALEQNGAVPPAPRALLEALVGTDLAASSPEHIGRGLDLHGAVAAKLSPSEREQLVSAISQGRRAFELAFHPSTERAASGMSITSVRKRLAELGEIVKVFPASTPKDGEAPTLKFVLVIVSDAAVEELAAAVGSTAEDVLPILFQHTSDVVDPIDDGFSMDVPSARNVLRVDVRRVDDAMDRLSDVLVWRFRLERAVDAIADAGGDVRALRSLTKEGAKQMRELRASVLGLRMVAVSELLDALPLLVRGLGAATKKPVELVRDIGSVEIDKAVAEPLWTVLVHLVRNAVDHGLEPAEERARSGKPAQGVIRVRAAQLGNSAVELVVEDDGRGIDVAKVASRAGVPAPTSDAALLDLLTRPGLSTRDAADATSGRGMGLDIVKKQVVERLAGQLRVRSVPGRGTAFTIRVPLTLSIVDAFRFRADDDTFLVPVAMVEELIAVEPDRVVLPPAVGSASIAVLERRGATIPLSDLTSVMGSPRAPRCASAIVVRRDTELFAFGVDSILGLHEIVVRPLADPLVEVAGITGATDLGDGTPTLVLDLIALTQRFAEERA